METEIQIPSKILDKINSDIETLYNHGVIDERIRVSIPNWFVKLFRSDDNEDRNMFIFGIKVVEGYNNQICVFDNFTESHSTIITEPFDISVEKWHLWR